MKRVKVEKYVKQILIDYPSSRSNDFILIDYLFSTLYPGLVEVYTFHEFISRYELFNFPSFESVSSARRKLQKKYPELRADMNIEMKNMIL